MQEHTCSQCGRPFQYTALAAAANPVLTTYFVYPDAEGNYPKINPTLDNVCAAAPPYFKYYQF